MERIRSRTWGRRTVAGLVVAATMALAAAAGVAAVSPGGPAHPTAGIRWDAVPTGKLAMAVTPVAVHGPIAEGIRWS